jgi:hypothetical protein
MQTSGSMMVHGKDGWRGTGVPASPSQPDALHILDIIRNNQIKHHSKA